MVNISDSRRKASSKECHILTSRVKPDPMPFVHGLTSLKMRNFLVNQPDYANALSPGSRPCPLCPRGSPERDMGRTPLPQAVPP